MIENNKEETKKDVADNQKEEELLSEKIINMDDLSPKSKQKIIFFVIFGILILIIIITLIIVFSLKEKNEEIEPPLIINATSGNHTHTIIFMPGYSNTPEDFKKIFTQKINFTKKNDTTIIILRSPLVDVSISHNKNYSWFDIYSFPLENYSCFNFEDLKKSAKVLEKVIDSEANVLNGRYDRIIIGGHSQGACISLYEGYMSDKNILGIFAFSGVLPEGEVKDSKKNLQTYFGYGDNDDVILPSFMSQSIERIENFTGFHKYVYKNHKHYVNRNETNDAAAFIENITNI